MPFHVSMASTKKLSHKEVLGILNVLDVCVISDSRNNGSSDESAEEVHSMQTWKEDRYTCSLPTV